MKKSVFVTRLVHFFTAGLFARDKPDDAVFVPG